MSNELVKIGSKRELQNGSNGLSRRQFLKIAGAGSTALGVAACTDSPSQKVLPYVKGEDQQIPGVSTWFSSTCMECTAGCGILVRTREGRAVKLEGNPDNPINRGGLCALGQSALQAHYDPDRIREPLARDSAGMLKPISWEDAYAKVAEALKAKGKRAIITGEVSGAEEELIAELGTAMQFEHVVYDVSQPVALAQASEAAYGSYGIPEYRFDRAEVVLNFGADFFETWISPCGYARDWAAMRRSGKVHRVIHVEPRLSLTGANADLWLPSQPGSEIALGLAVMKRLLEKGRGANLSSDVRAKLAELTRSVDLDKVSAECGVSREKILLAVDYLDQAKTSLVIAGGTAASTDNALSLQLVCAFLNMLLENVGESVLLENMRKPRSSLSKVATLIAGMKKGEYGVLFLRGVNPAYALPSSLEYNYARKTVGLTVSFATHLDESAAAADLILPASTSLESWGDARLVPGVYSLIQPAMGTIFNTRTFGDAVIEIARKAEIKNFGGGKKDFAEYLKASWEKLYSNLGLNAAGGFNSFWLRSVERGGYFKEAASGERVKVKVSADAFQIRTEAPAFDHKGTDGNLVTVYPYLSVKSFDGRSANRPWLQELPDPITQVVWDSWAELNSATAKELGVVQGDMLQLRNYYGEVNVPAYVTDYVADGVVAIPIGQGHTAYGRYAKQIAGGNVLELLPPRSSSEIEAVSLLSARAQATRGRGNPKLVNVDGSRTQTGRDLAMYDLVSTSAAAAAASTEHAAEQHGEHGAEHEHKIKQMYEQREHPLYKWGLAVDLATCTGCSACVVACYAENNISVVGKKACYEGREMSWLRIDRYFDGGGEEFHVSFMPMMCQQCGNAPCEPVCPVYATYHNEEGLNAMIYNRCVGTRYCSNNCSYKVRRFNWYEYDIPETLALQLNPDVVRRTGGIMEKCTFCVQRITEGKDRAKDLGRKVQDGDIQPACVQGCPTQALAFGDLNDPNSKVSRLGKDNRAYKVLDHHINTQPSITYLRDFKYRA
ncbi:MAG: molybdopterin-dependent oxidoreductase [Oligoflexia bacterium]|nr:molybdopterin-dependent oxidoreductase [Oligoflexia bacterium]